MRFRRLLIFVGILLLALLTGTTATGAGVGVASARPRHSASHKPRHKKQRKKHQKQSSSEAPLPPMGAEPSPSLFGLNTDLYDSNHFLFVKDVPASRELGARWDRYTAGPQTAEGKYGPLDWEVKQARGYGMGVILSFGGIPTACSLRPMPKNVEACPPSTAQDLTNYQAYVRRLVLHYRNVVDYYESWIEPNNHSNWLPGPNPAHYAALLEAQYAVIQSVNREYGLHIQLLFGSPIGFSIVPTTPGWIAVLPWTRRVLDDLHGQRPFDGVALLAYRFPPASYGPSRRAYDYVGGLPSASGASGPFPQNGCNSSPWCQMTWPQELSSYEQEFANYGYGQQPMWLTEFGWPGNTRANGGYFPSDVVQAAYLSEAYLDLLQLPFVKAAFWFNVRDYQPGYTSPDPSFFYHYGLLQYGFVLKPAATVFQTLAKLNPGR